MCKRTYAVQTHAQTRAMATCICVLSPSPAGPLSMVAGLRCSLLNPSSLQTAGHIEGAQGLGASDEAGQKDVPG